MTKKLLAGLVTLGAASMLCGFDSAETADSLLQKMNEASSSMSSMSANMDINLDAALNLGDGTTTSTLAIAVKGGFGMGYTMEPFAMKMDGSMKVSALGQGQDLTMQTYAVTNEDGALETYTFTKDTPDAPGAWAHGIDDSINMNELMELSKSMGTVDMSDWGLNFELAPEAADINGTECYQLSAVVDAAAFETMMNKSSELIGEDLASDSDVSMMMSYLDGIKMKMTYYVDAATYLPVSMHIDLNDSDLSVLNSLIATSMGEAAEGTTMELTLNDCSIDMTASYDDVAEITVPQEALDAVAAGAASSLDDLDDMVDDLEDAAEAATEPAA